MRNPLIALTVTATAVLAVAGCGGGSGNAHSGISGGSSMPGMTSSTMPGGAHNAADSTFAQSMIPHHQQAVAMANLAGGRALNPKVTQLAQRIAGAQQPEIATMTGWLRAWGAPTPQPDMSNMPNMPGMSNMPGMDHSGPGILTDQEMGQLTAASQGAFDRLFLQLMIRHHQGAIEMATTEQRAGQNTDAIAMAKGIITAQTAEITEMQQLTSQL